MMIMPSFVFVGCNAQHGCIVVVVAAAGVVVVSRGSSIAPTRRGQAKVTLLLSVGRWVGVARAAGAGRACGIVVFSQVSARLFPRP